MTRNVLRRAIPLVASASTLALSAGCIARGPSYYYVAERRYEASSDMVTGEDRIEASTILADATRLAFEPPAPCAQAADEWPPPAIRTEVLGADCIALLGQLESVSRAAGWEVIGWRDVLQDGARAHDVDVIVRLEESEVEVVPRRFLEARAMTMRRERPALGSVPIELDDTSAARCQAAFDALVKAPTRASRLRATIEHAPDGRLLGSLSHHTLGAESSGGGFTAEQAVFFTSTEGNLQAGAGISFTIGVIAIGGGVALVALDSAGNENGRLIPMAGGFFGLGFGLMGAGVGMALAQQHAYPQFPEPDSMACTAREAHWRRPDPTRDTSRWLGRRVGDELGGVLVANLDRMSDGGSR